MKFTDLSIQTQRAAPADIRSDGLAFLYRAGFISRSLEPTRLGQLAIEKLRQTFVAMSAGPADEKAPGQHPEVTREFFSCIGLQILRSHHSDEYFVAVKNGAQPILHCPACAYSAPREFAHAYRQPFSLGAALPLEKVLTPECHTIAHLAAFLQIPQEKTAKALMFTRLHDGKFVFVVVRGDMQLSEAKLKAQVGAVRLATVDEITASGAVPGYASPIGLQNVLIVLDDLAARSPNLVSGANEQGYHLKNTNHARDYQADLVVDLTLAGTGDPCPECHTALEMLEAESVCVDGGILFEKLLPLLAEIHHDEKGLTLPAVVSPFEVYLMNLPGKILNTSEAAGSMYAQLSEVLTVLFDDRDERAGVKFNDADLIGCPVRVTVGERALQNGMVELKRRSAAENQLIPTVELVEKIKASI